MSLYQRKDAAGNLLSPYWYCEFNDGRKVVRESTDVKIASRTPKAFEKSKAAARQAEALVKQHYFKEKDEAAANADIKPDTTFREFSKKFLDWVDVEYQSKPNTIFYYRDRIRSLCRFEKLASVQDRR
jgi:hypothetical protein